MLRMNTENSFSSIDNTFSFFASNSRMEAVTNRNIFDGTRTLERDHNYGISTRIATYKNESILLLQGNIDMVEVVKNGEKAVFLGVVDEATIIDPQSKSLDKAYTTFIEHNKLNLNLKKNDLVSVLTLICNHVSEICGNDDGDAKTKEATRIEMLKNPKCKRHIRIGDKNRKIPALKLEDVMVNHAANCRYNAMYTCYVLGRMVQEGKLPEGEAYIVRGEIKTGNGHAWVCFKTGNHLFLIDAYATEPLVLDVNKKEDRDEARFYFGKKAIATMIERYQNSDRTIENQFTLNC